MVTHGLIAKTDITMKNFKIWSLAVALLVAMTGCNDDETPTFTPGDVNKIVNEWQISEWDGAPAAFEVFIDFSEDGTFEMYQRFETAYECYTGTYSLDGNTLTGAYDDGNAWKNSYRAEVSKDAATLRLHSDDERSITSVYKQQTIPEYVKADATRSFEGEPFL